MIIRLRSIARGAIDISRVYVPRGVSHTSGEKHRPPLLSVADAQVLHRTCGRTERRTRRVPLVKPTHGLTHPCVFNTPVSMSAGAEDKRLHDASSGWMSSSSFVSPSTPATPSVTGSSSCAVDLSRSFGGFPTEAGGAIFSSVSATAMSSVDPVWSNFLQQVGF